MAYQAKFHDADQIALWFNGVLIQGFADGEYYSIEQSSPGFTSVAGTDGEVARSKSNDRRAKVTLKLLQTSSVNAQLSAIHQNDLNAPGGAGVGDFLMQDLQGTTLAQGSQCWITKYPDGKEDRTATSVEWEIEIANVNRTVGGN